LCGHPKGLMESDLFGHEKGAFTGPLPKLGRFELANQGTLFSTKYGTFRGVAAEVVARLRRRNSAFGEHADHPRNVRLVAAQES